MTDDFAISDKDTKKLQNILDSYLSDSPTSRIHKLDSELGCIDEERSETMEDICYFAALDIAGSGTVTELKNFFENEGEFMLAADCEDIILSYVNPHTREDASDVDGGKMDPKETPKISTISLDSLIEKLNKSLRKQFTEEPKKEFDIHNGIEKLLIGTEFEEKYTRDKEGIAWSVTFARPDFIFEEINTALEVKFCNSKEDVKKISKEMTTDIQPYKKKFQNIIFLVYDLGKINDVNEFGNDFNSIPDVTLLIIKG